jgi:hypothetical protein
VDASKTSTYHYQEFGRFDSSGNLLVGKTSTDNTTNGFVLDANGTLNVVRSSEYLMRLNRTTTDGEILRFGKDGTTVGSIGTDGTDIYIGTGDTGIRFNDAANGVLPYNTSTGQTDATLDLGFSTVRWRDLYLSGGVYLGGTGAANKLDDYEEGTWSIGLTFGGASVGMTTLTNEGAYTKVGNLVTCTGYFALTAKGSSTGDAIITGLPFTVSNTNAGYSALSIRNIRISFADILDGNTVKNGTTILLSETTNAGVISSITDGNFANDSGFVMSVTYRTD